jgi:enamine deaminase RidA (YjgF/YER057c/UK114 family)
MSMSMSMSTVTHEPRFLHSNPAFTQVVPVSAGADTIYVGGQNGVGPDGRGVGPGAAEQTRQAFANLRTCLDAVGAELRDVRDDG